MSIIPINIPMHELHSAILSQKKKTQGIGVPKHYGFLKLTSYFVVIGMPLHGKEKTFILLI
jgi:hypothetical protein